MIFMAPCIIDFIGANGLRGPVGGRGPWTLLGPGPLNGNERRSLGIDSTSLCSLAGRYDNPIWRTCMLASNMFLGIDSWALKHLLIRAQGSSIKVTNRFL